MGRDRRCRRILQFVAKNRAFWGGDRSAMAKGVFDDFVAIAPEHVRNTQSPERFLVEIDGLGGICANKMGATAPRHNPATHEAKAKRGAG